MAKIIEHNFNRKGGHPSRDLLTSSFGFYMQELQDMKLLLGEMVMRGRLFLEQEGMDPREFVLSETWLKDFLFTDLNGYEDGQRDYAELVYLNCAAEQVICVCQFAVPDGEGVAISYQIYSMDTGSQEDRRWKQFNFNTRTWVEEEEDCFDLSQVLYEYGLFQPKNKD